jgi:hypothetical protein
MATCVWFALVRSKNASIPSLALADSLMVLCFAHGTRTARLNSTQIDALLSYAGQIGVAVHIGGALGLSTIGRTSNEIFQARTRYEAVVVDALSVATAR